MYNHSLNDLNLAMGISDERAQEIVDYLNRTRDFTPKLSGTFEDLEHNDDFNIREKMYAGFVIGNAKAREESPRVIFSGAFDVSKDRDDDD